MAFITPYDPFPFLTELSIIFEKLSPAINTWIENNQEIHKEAHKQAVFRKRVKACKRYCRVNKLNKAFIGVWVADCFTDLTAAKQIELADLVAFELKQ